MKKIRIDRSGDSFQIYDPKMPGSSGGCGYDKSLMVAMGRFLYHAQKELGIEFEVSEEAQPFIDACYKRELAKR